MRSAADMPEVGWPEPAAVVQRMLSMRNWAASSFQFCWGSAMTYLRVQVENGFG